MASLVSFPSFNFTVVFQTLCFLLGAWAFIELEYPREESQHKLKKEKNVDVDKAVAYLKTIFWQYANNQNKYNYTRDQFKEVVRT